MESSFDQMTELALRYALAYEVSEACQVERLIKAWKDRRDGIELELW
jgi:hypothetical protein